MEVNTKLNNTVILILSIREKNLNLRFNLITEILHNISQKGVRTQQDDIFGFAKPPKR